MQGLSVNGHSQKKSIGVSGGFLITLTNYDAQIFLDMAVLVDAQGDMLDNIESQVSQISSIRLSFDSLDLGSGDL